PFLPRFSTSSRSTILIRTRPPQSYDPSFVVALAHDGVVARLVTEVAVDNRLVDTRALELLARLGLLAQVAQLTVAVAALTAAIAVAAALGPLRHLANAVRQQCHLARDANRARDRNLLLLRVAGDPPGADLGALRHEPAQQVHVLVVDPVDAFG